MRQLSSQISLFFILLACLPSGYCHAFFSNQKINENYLLSGFSNHFTRVGSDDGFRLSAGIKTDQADKINLPLSAVCPIGFYLEFPGFKPSHAAFTSPFGQSTTTKTFTATYIHPEPNRGFIEISGTKHTLTLLPIILIFSEGSFSPCKARRFELCKKANDNAGLHTSYPIISKICSKFLPEPPQFETTFNSPSSFNRCE
jgi:hypothetical protein